MGELLALERPRRDPKKRRTFGTMKYLPPEVEVRPRGVWVIEAQPEVMLRLKRIFLRIDRGKRGMVWITDSPEICRDLSWVMQRYPMEMDAGTRVRLKEGTRQHIRTEETVIDILAGHEQRLGTREPARQPRDYQRVAGNLILSTKRLLLVDDLGLGKTFSLLLTLMAEDALPALVVTLTHLPGQWLEELELSFPELRGHVVRKGTPYDPSKHRSMKGRQPDVLIMNYAKLAGWADYLSGRVRTVLYDEIQELRRDQSQKYDAAAQIADGALYKAGATTTPVYNYGGEIHNVVSILDTDILGTREEFIREWGAGDSGDKLKVKEPDALGSYLRSEGIMLKRTREEVGRELPPTVRVPHTVETDERTLFRLTAGTLDLADLILSRAGTKEEVFKASGELDWKMRHATGVAKARYVAEFVRLLLEEEEKVLLFGWHRDVYDIWLQMLADFNPVMFTGSESPAGKERSKQAFVDGDSRVLLMSLRAGAGLNGVQEVCKVCVFGELDWSPGVHDQCIGRLRRDRDEDEGKVAEEREAIKQVFAYFLVANEGSDPVVAEVLNLKRMQSEPMINPDRPLFEGASDAGDRVRRLAQFVKESREKRE